MDGITIFGLIILGILIYLTSAYPNTTCYIVWGLAIGILGACAGFLVALMIAGLLHEKDPPLSLFLNLGAIIGFFLAFPCFYILIKAATYSEPRSYKKGRYYYGEEED